MNTLITVAVMLAALAAPVPAHAEPDTPTCLIKGERACIQEGMRDYREGQCYQARPYSDDIEEGQLWIKGYLAQAKKKPRDMSRCYGTGGH